MGTYQKPDMLTSSLRPRYIMPLVSFLSNVLLTYYEVFTMKKRCIILLNYFWRKKKDGGREAERKGGREEGNEKEGGGRENEGRGKKQRKLLKNTIKSIEFSSHLM